MKIALCFSGQPRALQQGYQFYKKNLLDRYDVDVYVHSWNTESNQEYLDLYKPVKYQFDDMLKVDVSRYTYHPMPLKHPKEHTHPMYYSLYAANQLIEGDYDWVIRSRTDYALNVALDFSQYDSSKIHIPDCYIAPERDTGNDQFAFGSMDVMRNYCSTYLNIDEHYDNGCLFNGEQLMQANLHKHNLIGDNLVYVHMNNPFGAGRYNGGTHSLIRDDFLRWNPGVTVW